MRPRILVNVREIDMTTCLDGSIKGVKWKNGTGIHQETEYCCSRHTGTDPFFDLNMLFLGRKDQLFVAQRHVFIGYCT